MLEIADFLRRIGDGKLAEFNMQKSAKRNYPPTREQQHQSKALHEYRPEGFELTNVVALSELVYGTQNKDHRTMQVLSRSRYYQFICGLLSHPDAQFANSIRYTLEESILKSTSKTKRPTHFRVVTKSQSGEYRALEYVNGIWYDIPVDNYGKRLYDKNGNPKGTAIQLSKNGLSEFMGKYNITASNSEGVFDLVYVADRTKNAPEFTLSMNTNETLWVLLKDKINPQNVESYANLCDNVDNMIAGFSNGFYANVPVKNKIDESVSHWGVTSAQNDSTDDFMTNESQYQYSEYVLDGLTATTFENPNPNPNPNPDVGTEAEVAVEAESEVADEGEIHSFTDENFEAEREAEAAEDLDAELEAEAEAERSALQEYLDQMEPEKTEVMTALRKRLGDFGKKTHRSFKWVTDAMLDTIVNAPDPAAQLQTYVTQYVNEGHREYLPIKVTADANGDLQVEVVKGDEAIAYCEQHMLAAIALMDENVNPMTSYIMSNVDLTPAIYTSGSFDILVSLHNGTEVVYHFEGNEALPTPMAALPVKLQYNIAAAIQDAAGFTEGLRFTEGIDAANIEELVQNYATNYELGGEFYKLLTMMRMQVSTFESSGMSAKNLDPYKSALAALENINELMISYLNAKFDANECL